MNILHNKNGLKKNITITSHYIQFETSHTDKFILFQRWLCINNIPFEKFYYFKQVKIYLPPSVIKKLTVQSENLLGETQ